MPARSSAKGPSAAFAASMLLYSVLILLAWITGLLPDVGHARVPEWLLTGIGLHLVLEALLRAISAAMEPAIWKAVLGLLLIGGALAAGTAAGIEAMWPFGLVALGVLGALRTVSRVVHHH